MFVTTDIGNRIRVLRKKKKVSQEVMAADLGMYQADISNLERAMGGSGINDLFKLDAVAVYLGVSIVELLTGISMDSVETLKAKESTMQEGRAFP